MRGREPAWFRRTMEDGRPHSFRVLNVRFVPPRGALLTLGHPTDRTKKAAKVWVESPFSQGD